MLNVVKGQGDSVHKQMSYVLRSLGSNTSMLLQPKKLRRHAKQNTNCTKLSLPSMQDTCTRLQHACTKCNHTSIEIKHFSITVTASLEPGQWPPFMKAQWLSITALQTSPSRNSAVQCSVVLFQCTCRSSVTVPKGGTQ